MSITDDQTLLRHVVLDEAHQHTLTEAEVTEPNADTGPLGDLLAQGEGAATLNHYVLLSKLGEGGMGVVYAAFDQKLDRKVALKLLRATTDRKARRRLVREAQSLARLSHPNVVQIYEIDEAEGLIYIVMEFVNGLTLREWLTVERRSQREIVEVFAAAGRGLAAAHAEGLVHRDFKPDNVMIREDGRVLVMDFGLAQPDDDGSPQSARANPVIEPSGLTATGALMGTPAYMAPEQFEHRPTDPRTDQFSFCVALWEALHGKRPFEANSLMELSVAVCTGSFVVPEHSEVPSWLRKVVARGLEVEPGDRWPAMNALLDALRRDPTRRRRALLASLIGAALTLAVVAAVVVVRERDQARTRRACEDEGAALAWDARRSAAIEEVFTATGLAYAPSAWAHTRALLDAYASSWTAARTQACVEARVDETRDEAQYMIIARCLDERRAKFEGLLDAWAELDERSLARTTQAAASLEPVDTCAEQLWLAQRVQAAPQQQAEVERLRAELARAGALQAATKYEDGLAVARAVVDEAAQLHWRPLEAEARHQLAQLQDKLGDYEAARAAAGQAYLDAVGSGHELAALDVASFMASLIGDQLADPKQGRYWAELALEHVERLGLRGTVREARALNGLGACHARAGELAEAMASHARAQAIIEEVLGPEHLYVADSINNYGNAQWELGELEPAMAAFRRALELRVRALGPAHPAVATSHNNIGVVLWNQGDYEGALREFRNGLELREAALGPMHPDVGGSYNNVGAVLASSGAHAEALEAFAEALKIQEATVGAEHPDIAGTLTNMAGMLRFEGKLDEALAMHERALAIWEKAYGPEHQNVALALNNIGIVHSAQGDHEASLATHQRALAIREAKLGPDHPSVAQSLGNLAIEYSDLGRVDEAIETQRRALAIREAKLGPDHPDVATSIGNIGVYMRERGDYDEAIVMQRRALAIHEAATGPESRDAAHCLVELALSQLELGQLDRALVDVQRVLAMADAASLVDAERGEVRFILARVQWARGDHDDARATAQAALAELEAGSASAAGEGNPDKLAEVQAWLARHG